MSDHPSNEVDVEVRPFKHQVGGHTCVLEVTRSTICKPFIPREAWFYQNEPDELKEFTPKYLGETFVTCDIQSDRKCLVARVPEDIVTQIGYTKLEPEQGSSKQSSNSYPRKRRKHSNSECRRSLETWSSMCIDRQINKYGFWANNQPQKFILLENLVHEYEHPCLMDLKMGRRQFGEDSNEEKRKLLESRCASSTSATLGFRISGSQTYNVNFCGYTFHDKYFGRNLDSDGAIKELKQFFHNGAELRIDVLRQMVVKLEALQSVLLCQTDLFFHSASLLLLYDGASPKCSICSDCKANKNIELEGNQVDLKTKIENGVYSKSTQEDDNCTAFNLDYTNNLTSNIKDDVGCKLNFGTEVNQTSDLTNRTVKQLETNSDKDRQSESTRVKKLSCKRCGKPNTGNVKVDVKMIDFAHVSEKFKDEDKIENIADDTIVFGLIKLKEILIRLLECSNSA